VYWLLAKGQDQERYGMSNDIGHDLSEGSREMVRSCFVATKNLEEEHEHLGT